jgi:kinesin family protein 2/24
MRIERMEAEREERRRLMQERKVEREKEEKRNLAAGNPGDVDFIGLVKKWRDEHANDALSLVSNEEQPKICIAVRKRPISDKERKRKDHDSVTCYHPTVTVHNCKVKVDGITKYLDHSSFCFDYGIDEDQTTEDIYQHSTLPLVEFTCSGKGGRATVFAYGQTGSGKTYTMNGIEAMVAEDIFHLLSLGNGPNLDDTIGLVSFFEIYGGRIQDLLNKRQRLKVLEDGKGEVVVTGLREFEANDPQHLLEYIESAQK